MCSRADILESADSENGTGTSIITVPVKITPRGPQRHCRHSDNYTKEDIGYRIQIFDTEQKRGYLRIPNKYPPSINDRVPNSYPQNFPNK